MPPVDAEYLIAHLFEIGPTMVSGGYPAPITHGELRAWQDNVGITLHSWESRFIRRLSCEYIAELHRAEKADCPEPMRQEQAPVSIAAKNLQQALRALAKL